jgi:hypothetical protein
VAQCGEENSSPYRDFNSGVSDVQPVAGDYTDYAIPAPYVVGVVFLNTVDEHLSM